MELQTQAGKWWGTCAERDCSNRSREQMGTAHGREWGRLVKWRVYRWDCPTCHRNTTHLNFQVA